MFKNNSNCNHYQYNNDCINSCCSPKCIEGPAGPRGPQGPQGRIGPQGIQGEQGPQGEIGLPGLDGADGIIGTIRSTVATISDLPSTGVVQGDIYYVEEDGKIYLWDNGNWVELSVIQGPQGPQGIQGEKGEAGEDGEDGIVGTINGVVTTFTALPTTGIEQGDIYYVSDTNSLYVWDQTAGWTLLGLIQGPRGPQGEQGVQGEQGEQGIQGDAGVDGIIGTINGTVALIADLPTTGIEQGDIYYVEEDRKIYIWDNDEWVELSAIQGPRGPQGEQGEKGEDGIIGPIKGTVATVDELPTTGIEQGDIYYVESDQSLYVWDEEWVKLGLVQGPQGIQGPQGEVGPQGIQGPAATAYMIIPFASAEAPMSYTINGEPERVSLIGFGYGDRRDHGFLTAADYSIIIDPTDHSFSLTSAAGNDNKQLVFSLPFDVSIKSIYITVGNYGLFTTNFALFPYIQLFQAPAGSNNFTAIENAFVIPEQGIGPGTNIPADTMRSAQKDGLDIKLSAGTRIGIGAMLQVPGFTGGSEHFWLYFTGGIGLAYEPN